MSDEAGREAPREPATVDQPAAPAEPPGPLSAAHQPAASPPVPPPPGATPPTVVIPAAAAPHGRGSGNVLTMVAIGVAGLVLGAVVGAGATAAIDNWSERHGPRADRGPAWIDEGPRR